MYFELRNSIFTCLCEREARGNPGFTLLNSGLPRYARKDERFRIVSFVIQGIVYYRYIVGSKYFFE